MTTCAPGALSQFLVKDGASAGSAPAYDWTSGTRYAYAYNRETFGAPSQLLIGNGITGDRASEPSLVREGNYQPGGTVEMDWSPGVGLSWLPRILGGTFSGNVITVANSLPSFGCLFKKSTTKDYEYRDCMVDQWLLHGLSVPGDRPPMPLTCHLGIIGKAEKEPATESGYTPWTFPTDVTLGSSLAYSPLVMSDADPGNAAPGEITLATLTCQIKEFWLLVNNFVHPRWVNSQTPTLLCPQRRVVMLRTRMAYDGTVADFNQAATGTNTGTLTFKNSTVSTSFSFVNLKRPRRTPFVLGKTEVDITTQWIAFQSADRATKEIVVTNDSTP